MIIVITHDQEMRDYYGTYVQDRKENYEYWQRVKVLDAGLNREGATEQLTQWIKELRSDEPLCLIGHGNDDGIGDRPQGLWWWSADVVAAVFSDALPDNYQGAVLMEACGTSVANLPPRIALALGGGRLVGVWIYGHQYAVGITDPLPNGTQLGGAFYPGAKIT